MIGPFARKTTLVCLAALTLSGCGAVGRSDSPSQVTPPGPPAPTTPQPNPQPNPQPSPQPSPPPAPPAPPSINGRYSGQTVVSASTSLPGVSVPPTTVRTDFDMAESGGAVTAIGKVVPTDKPEEASDVTANGTRTDSSLQFTLPFNPACSSVTLSGTIQPNADIAFVKGQQEADCTVNTLFGPVKVRATLSYDAFTLVKQ